MNKELEEFYKQYSARITELDDTPLFATGTFGTFRILSIEEYDNINQQISDLEVKLAESELKYNATNRAYWELVEKQDNDFLQYEKLTGENQKLKQQLAEKDAEIRVAYSFRKQKCDNLQKALAEKDEQLQQAIEIINNPDTLFYQQQELIDNLKLQLAEKEKENELMTKTLKMTKFVEKEIDQDKISFCIEKLEKVKETMLDNAWRMDSAWENAFELIDNQITNLKKGVE